MTTAAAPTTTGRFESFACPVCGRLRPLARHAMQRTRAGRSSGECKPGVGCRAALEEPEKLRRFWLEAFGVDEADLRRAGSAAAYIDEHGLPGELQAVADALPENLPFGTRVEQHLAEAAHRASNERRRRSG